MVKFGKNKLKTLNKIAKKQNIATSNVTNKVLKKKLNAEKKVSFQKEILLREAVAGVSPLVKNISSTQVILEKLSKTPEKKGKPQSQIQKPKIKPVEKQKKRQKTQIIDTKLLLKLMKKK